MIRVVGCLATTAAAIALEQHGLIPTWLATTVGILAMVAASALVAIEEIR